MAEHWLAVLMGTLAMGTAKDKVLGGKEKALQGACRPVRADSGSQKEDGQGDVCVLAARLSSSTAEFQPGCGSPHGHCPCPCPCSAAHCLLSSTSFQCCLGVTLDKSFLIKKKKKKKSIAIKVKNYSSKSNALIWREVPKLSSNIVQIQQLHILLKQRRSSRM